MKLLWAPAANRDRKRIRSYIEADNPAAAAALDERLAQAAAHLEAHPFLGRPGRRGLTREFVAERNYILILHGRCGHRPHPARHARGAALALILAVTVSR